MDIKNFISKALCEIIAGIKDAQNKTTDNSIVGDDRFFVPRIVPTPVAGGKELYHIEFDLAVIVDEKASFNGEANFQVINIPVVKLEGDLMANNFYSNRIKFSIPIIYPSVPKPHY